MGQLRNLNFEHYNLDVYVETGTGVGITLSKAILYFQKCFSVDIDADLVSRARTTFPTATIEHSLSTSALEKWLQNDIPTDATVFFFLDAHFPGADYKGQPYDIFKTNAIPLKDELTLIKKYRPHSKDIIICDDARLYTLGNFEHGNVEWLQIPGGYKFILDLFPDDPVYLYGYEEGYFVIDRRFKKEIT